MIEMIQAGAKGQVRLVKSLLGTSLCDLNGKITYYDHTQQFAHSIELNKK